VNCSEISAVIVTKGDVDLSPILESLPFEDVVVWDNSKELVDRKVYGRYLAIPRCKHDFIYVQDDDCIVPAEDLIFKAFGTVRALALLAGMILCNIPSQHHRDFYGPLGLSLVGWGAVFHRKLADFSRYFAAFPCDELFERECDRVFTALNPSYVLDVGVTNLEHAKGADRMGRESRHGDDLAKIRARIDRLRAKAA
jgi:hypothetical protein